MAYAVNVICWLWGTKYVAHDVQRLQEAVRRNLSVPHRFVLFTDQALALTGIDARELEDRALTTKSCFCRLRMFDQQWQKRQYFREPIFSLDLDLLIANRLDDLLVTNSTFKILQGVNAVNPCPFNASVMLLKPGYHGEVWSDFSIQKAKEIPYHEFPDDQGWIWHKLPNADGWKAGFESGIYGFHKPGWPGGDTNFALPLDARIVSFIGKRKPEMYKRLPWVKKYWSALA